jgi:YtkA-like
MPFAHASGAEILRQRKPPRKPYAICRSGTLVAGIMVATSSAASVLAGGCAAPSARRSPGIAIENQITPQPVRVGAATVTLKLADGAEKAISGARIALEADMSHPGMSPEFGEAKEIAAGRYQGSVTFTMAGDWVLLVHIALPGGQKIERQINVGNVRAS